MDRNEIVIEINRLSTEVQKRTRLGGYDSNADGILDLYRTALRIMSHLACKEDLLPPPTKRKK